MELVQTRPTRNSTRNLSTMSEQVCIVSHKSHIYGFLPSVPVALTKYLPKTKVRKQKNLLGGTTAGEESDVEEEVGHLIEINASHFSRCSCCLSQAPS